jgi:hypothetical protein
VFNVLQKGRCLREAGDGLQRGLLQGQRDVRQMLHRRRRLCEVLQEVLSLGRPTTPNRLLTRSGSLLFSHAPVFAPGTINLNL